MNITKLREIQHELIALATRKADAADDFKAGIDAAALEIGCSKTALRKVVVAIYRDRKKHEAEVAEEINALLTEIA